MCAGAHGLHKLSQRHFTSPCSSLSPVKSLPVDCSTPQQTTPGICPDPPHTVTARGITASMVGTRSVSMSAPGVAAGGAGVVPVDCAPGPPAPALLHLSTRSATRQALTRPSSPPLISSALSPAGGLSKVWVRARMHHGRLHACGQVQTAPLSVSCLMHQ